MEKEIYEKLEEIGRGKFTSFSQTTQQMTNYCVFR